MNLRESMFESLGGDVLALILQLLPRADLHALSLANKAMRAFTEPVLYSHIEWTWLADQTPPISYFLRTVDRRPELAAHVRSVVLLGDTFYQQPFHGKNLPNISPVGLDLDEGKEAIEKTRVRFAGEWKEGLCRGTMDAYIALLLSQLYHLRRLAFSKNFTLSTRLMGLLLDSALCKNNDYKVSTFCHVCEVTYKGDLHRRRDMYGRDTEAILPFFYLPAANHLSLAFDNPVNIQWSTRAPDPARLRSLHLTDIREKCLSPLLSVTRGLETLQWEFFYCPDFEHSSNTSLVDLNEVANALSHVRSTLKELTISASSVMAWSDLDLPFLDISGSLAGLADFGELEKFQVPLPFLVKFSPEHATRLEDVVPKQLRYLTITDDLHLHEENEWTDTATLDVLRIWLRSLRVSNPHLNTFSLLLKETNDEWNPSIREELIRTGNQFGIKVEITKFLADMY